MKNLSKEQIESVIEWMNTWEQLKDTAIPIRFKEDFTKLLVDPPVRKRVRFYPRDVEETFDGTVIEETQYSYLVIPDDNLAGTARWNKRYCDILH